jgi:hypothetical protein
VSDGVGVTRLLLALGVVVVALSFAGTAGAFSCPATPLEERIAGAEAVFVGRSTGSTPVAGGGVPQRLYRFEIDQEVKGNVGHIVMLRVPVRPENGGQSIPNDVAAGILANRVGNDWFTTRCGITDPGAVLATVDKPKGNAVKLAIGILILLAVLGYSFRQLRKKRPGLA